MAVEFKALMAAHHVSRLDPRNLGIGHNRIWAEADKEDNKFSMIKNHIMLRCTVSKNWIVILTKEEWDKKWPKQLRKWYV